MSDVIGIIGGTGPHGRGLALRLSAVAEDLTALLISVNRRYRTHASIVLTGVDTGVDGGEG